MKKFRIVSLFICIAALILSAIEITLAFPSEPTVSYDGKAKEFIFVNTVETDLFPSFKEVVPGDCISQEINVRGNHISTATDFYLRAEVEDDIVIPEEIVLKVYLENEMISSSSLNTSGSLTENVHLCQLTKDGSVKLKAVLEVPTSVGNEISDMQKEVKWIFTAQEKETGDDSGNNKPGGDDSGDNKPGGDDSGNDKPQGGTGNKPGSGSSQIQTGDQSRPILWIGVNACSLIFIVVLLFTRKKEESER